MNKERFERQLEFILEADKEKNIFRQTPIGGMIRRENDAEHAWHMAMMIYLLREYANEKFDVARAMMMALIHDIVEIDAGDTYAYDDKGVESQREREAAAAERIFGILPPDQKEEMLSLFREFDEAHTPEARFARAMDNFQPILLNNSNGGGDWLEHKVDRTHVYARHMRTKEGSSDIWNKSKEIIDEYIKRGIIDDK